MENLENKVGYRVLKVLYYLYYIILTISIFIWLSSGISSLVEFILVYLSAIIFNELIHLGLFYIFFGDLNKYNYSLTKKIFLKYKNSEDNKVIINKKIEENKEDEEITENKEKIYKISRGKKFLMFFGMLSFISGFNTNIEDHISLIFLGLAILMICINHTELNKKYLGYKYNKKLLYVEYILIILIGVFSFLEAIRIFIYGGEKGNYGFIVPFIIYIPLFLYKEVKYSIKNKKFDFFIGLLITILVPGLLFTIFYIKGSQDKGKKYSEVSQEIENKNFNTKTEKELFLEELKKISGIKNQKIDELTTHTERKLEESNGRYTFVYTYKSIEDKSYFLDNFSEISKGETIKNFREIKETNKEAKYFIDMSIKHNIYYGFKYYDKNNDLISYFEISPKELSEIDNITYEIEDKEEQVYGIMTENTNLREGISLNGKIFRILKKGEKILYNPRSEIFNDGYSWVMVSTSDGLNGWAVIDWIKKIN